MTANNPSQLVSTDRVTVEENTPYVTGTMVVADADGMTNGRYEILTNCNYGQVTMNSDGEWIYVPQPDWVGWDKFLVLVTDDLGHISTHYMQIYVAPTTAKDDEVNTVESAAVAIDVLANDQITGENKVVTHINGQEIAVGSVIEVINGHVTLLENGQLEFTPVEGYTGPANFEYTAQSDSRAPTTATVSIVVTNPDVQLAAVQIDELGTLNSPYPHISGSTQMGTAVTVSISNAAGEVMTEGTAVVNQDGTWTFADPSVEFTDGVYTVTAVASHAAGVSSEVSSQSFNIDVTAPNTLFAVLENDTGASDTDQMTIDGKVKVTGIEEGATWFYSLDNGANWTQGFGSSFIVPEGSHTVLVKQQDAAGNSEVQSLGLVTVDNTPVNLTINSVGPATNSTPVLTGTTDAGNVVTVEVRTEEGELITSGLATVNGTTWSFAVTEALADAVYYSVSAVAENAIGATQEEKLTILVDATSPVGLQAALMNDTGAFDTDGLTTDGRVKVTGVESGAIWSYSLDQGVTWIAGVGTRFSLASGFHEGILVKQVDSAGLEEVIQLEPITVDLSTELSIYGAYDNAGASQGHINAGQLTDDTQPTLYGTAEPGATLKFYLNDVLLAETVVAENGQWSYTVQEQLDGDYVFKANATDLAGNTAEKSFNFSVSAETSHQPEVYLNSGALLGLVEADVLGILTLENRPLAVFDRDNDLKQVVLQSTSLLGVSGSWSYSNIVAEQLGLNVVLTNSDGLLGVVATSSTLTISAVDNGVIDNLKVIEFLATVYQPNLLNVAGSIELTAVDMQGNAKTTSLSSLLDVGLLGVAPQVMDTANSYNQALATTSVLVYGDDTNDVLVGSAYSDILRGGAGNDTINGGAGNDYIVGGAGNDLIIGGVGADTLVFDLLDPANATGGNGTDTWSDFNLAEDDNIDISGLLGEQISALDLNQYVQLNYDEAAQTVTLQIDRDGAGNNTHQMTDLLVLSNQTSAITLNELLENQQILF